VRDAGTPAGRTKEKGRRNRARTRRGGSRGATSMQGATRLPLLAYGCSQGAGQGRLQIRCGCLHMVVCIWHASRSTVRGDAGVRCGDAGSRHAQLPVCAAAALPSCCGAPGNKTYKRTGRRRARVLDRGADRHGHAHVPANTRSLCANAIFPRALGASFNKYTIERNPSRVLRQSSPAGSAIQSGSSADRGFEFRWYIPEIFSSGATT